MGKAFTSYQIEERSFVAYIKREIHNHVLEKGFSPGRIGEIDIVVSEMCSNLIKHASGGELLYRIEHTPDDDPCVELVCIDKGPGMADPQRMMKDGVSTTKTLGHGLGSIERLSTHFQVYSMVGWGTILYSRISATKVSQPRKPGFDLDISALCVNKPREQVCGDGYRVKRTENEVKVFFGDGLGHGAFAHEAVERAGDFFSETDEVEPVEIIRKMHEKVRRTRGLVASIAVLDKRNNKWSICGIGNILSRIYTGIVYKNYMAYNGTLGLNIPNSLKSSVFPVERHQHLIMCSDGIKSRWEMTKYPSILKYDNLVLCASLYKDFNRGTDDSSILIAKVV